MIVGVTGGRPSSIGLGYDIYADEWSNIRHWLWRNLNDLSPDRFFAGGALGVDWIATEEALGLNIPVTVAMPFEKYTSKWPSSTRMEFNRLMKECDTTYVNKGGYSVDKLHARNRYIVDNIDVLLAGPGGRGTQNTIEYAQERIQVIQYG